MHPKEGTDYSFSIPGPEGQLKVPPEPLIEETRTGSNPGTLASSPQIAPVSPPSPARIPVPPLREEPPPVSSNGAEADSDYFYLSTPILVDGREFKRLRLNPKGVLRGKQFFQIIDRYQRKFPEEARTNFNKFTSENFLSLVLAEINKPLVPEDLYKVDYIDLPLLFLQAASFHFTGGAARATPGEETKTLSTTGGESS